MHHSTLTPRGLFKVDIQNIELSCHNSARQDIDEYEILFALVASRGCESLLPGV